MDYQLLIDWKNSELEHAYEAAPAGYFRVTKKWIFDNSCSESVSAWTRLQKEMLGCGLHAGWIERASGTLIEDWRKTLFENDSAATNERKQLN